MNETKVLIEKITEGIQEKKGKNIVIADLTNIAVTYVLLELIVRDILTDRTASVSEIQP